MSRTVIFLVALCLAGCASFYSQNQRKNHALGWQEITHGGVPEFRAPHRGWTFDVPIAKKYLAKLPTSLSKKPELAKLAFIHDLAKPQLYDKGVLGKKQGANFFVALKKDIPDYPRLYWVIVRVLSKEYGCFMKARFNIKQLQDGFGVKCRDGRIVVFSRRLGLETLEFVSRQFDRKGRELVVRNHKIVSRSRGLKFSSWNNAFKTRFQMIADLYLPRKAGKKHKNY